MLRHPNLDTIKRAVSEAYFATGLDWDTRNRLPTQVAMRKMFCYIAYDHFGFSYPEIARFLRSYTSTVQDRVKSVRNGELDETKFSRIINILKEKGYGKNHPKPSDTGAGVPG